ncbi:MAG: 2,3,4,5-tetrahydropyridine-2,6-dicarboxylate N-succinyltransferase [Bacteroidota bacterium]
MSLPQRIEELSSADPSRLDTRRAREVFAELLEELAAGRVRAARCTDGIWKANTWVKKGILLGFRIGVLAEAAPGSPFPFFDRDTMALKPLGREDGVRLVPGGSAVRHGAYLAPGVVCMPPMYINIGAYVDRDTMVDSHALVGSCAQIGKRVHLSAGAQVGGVLEPPGALPVIVEDEVFVGGLCGIFEGTVVRRRAVLAAGTVLSGGSVVHDTVRRLVYRREGDRPLEIPEGAVVVPGSRPARDDWGRACGLQVASPVILKYRDERTDASTTLEEMLR